MAGYNDTRNLIIEALMGRQAGTEIQPENHQAYALNMLDYVRSVELVSTSTLTGLAEESTVPVQPNNGKVCYIAGVGQDRTVTFNNFIDEEGNPISVTTGEMEGVFVILLWNMEYWTAYTFNTNIISSAEAANFYYGYNIRKTYASVAAMNADSVNPIGTDGRLIKIGELVTVVNSTTPSENGYYSYEGSENGWLLQSGFSFEIVQTTGTDINKTMSQKAVTDELALKAAHGYESNPKTLKEVDDEIVQVETDLNATNRIFTLHGYYFGTTGGFLANESWRSTPLLKLNGDIKVKCYLAVSGTQGAITFYDSNKEFVSSLYAETAKFQERTILESSFPSGAAFFAVSTLTTDVANSYVYFGAIGSYIPRIEENVTNITQNTSNVKRVKNSGKEFFSINGKYYRADNGILANASPITCTDKLPINGDINTFCYMGGISYPDYGISFFDESKQFISGLSSIDGIYGEKDYYIPSSLFPANAKYFSLSNFTDSLSNAFLISGLQGNLLNRVNVIEESIYPIPTMETDISDLQKTLSYLDAIAGAVITTSIGDQAFKNAVSAIWIKMIVPDAILPEKLYLVNFGNQAGMYKTALTFYDSIGGTAIFSYSANDGPKTGVQNLVIRATSAGGLDGKANLQVVIDWDIISGESYSPNSTEFITSDMNRSQTPTMDLKEKVVEIDEKISILNQITLQGKTIVSFGDSLTEMVDTTNSKHYTDYISEKTGATVINLGIGGTHLRQRTTPTPLFSDIVQYNINDRVLYEDNGVMKWYKFTSSHLGAWSGTDVELLTSNSLVYANVDIINLIKASCNQQFSDVIAAAKYIAATQSDDNIATINRLIAIDWSKVDGVTVFGGTNDWSNSNTIGTTGNNDIKYTLGAINEIIRLLLSTYPHLKIYWFTPIVRWLDYNQADGAGTDAQWSDVYSVTGNGTLKEFSAKIQTEVSLNHIPICDIYNTLGWNKYNFKNYFIGIDGTHPRTYNGVTYLAKKIASFILANNTI